MNEMVEHVAKAMRKALGIDWPYAGHAELQDVAQAAIEALRPVLEQVRDHIVGSTGALPGSDSAEQVEIINSILDGTPLPPDALPSKARNATPHNF